MSACDCCTLPLVSVTRIGKGQAGETFDGYDTAHEAYLAAVAAIGGDYSYGFPYGFIFKEDSGQWNAVAGAGKYRMGGYSATGYLRIWWDEVVTKFRGGDEISRTGFNTEITFTAGVDGLIIPGNVRTVYPDLGDLDGVPDWITVEAADRDITSTEPPEPEDPYTNNQYNTNVEIKKWSAVAGYNPPDDGSANGFPA